MAIPIYASPWIECENPKYDFGTVIGRKKITHEFIIWNKGDEPVEILKIKNCCGVETKVVPMTIAPGSNAVCTSVFTTKNRYGEQDKQILLITNDKKHLYFDLRMTGTLMNPVEFAPRWIRLDDLVSDSTVSETITATNLLDTAITLESVATTISGLDAEIVDCRGGTVENLPAESGQEAGRSRTIPALQKKAEPTRSWNIQLRSSEPLAIGRINGQVHLNFSTGTVNVPIIGEVRPIIEATSASIQRGESSTDAVERLIMLRSGDGRAFEVLSAKLENAEGKVETKKLADGKWQIKLTLQPASIKPDASITIQTSIQSQDSITIALSQSAK